MKRSGFKRPQLERKPQPAYEPVERRGSYGPAETTAGPKPPEAVQHEGYMAIVRTLRCAHCGKPGPSQFCHRDMGKGIGLKTDCREGFPGCPECHVLLGSSGKIPREVRRDLEKLYGYRTRWEVELIGWPRGLPKWVERAS